MVQNLPCPEVSLQKTVEASERKSRLPRSRANVLHGDAGTRVGCGSRRILSMNGSPHPRPGSGDPGLPSESSRSRGRGGWARGSAGPAPEELRG